MYCLAKAAISLDGYLDDTQAHRRVFSGAEDTAAVENIRARFDAILVGAETVRADNPGLRIRDATLIRQRVRRGQSAQPRRITLTHSGALPLTAAFFSPDEQPPLVFTTAAAMPPSTRDALVAHAELVVLKARTDGESSDVVDAIVRELQDRGIQSLLIEGGARTLGLFLANPAVSEFRLAIAPDVLGANGRAHLFSQIATTTRFELLKLEQYDTLAVHHYRVFQE